MIIRFIFLGQEGEGSSRNEPMKWQWIGDIDLNLGTERRPRPPQDAAAQRLAPATQPRSPIPPEPTAASAARTCPCGSDPHGAHKAGQYAPRSAPR